MESKTMPRWASWLLVGGCFVNGAFATGGYFLYKNLSSEYKRLAEQYTAIADRNKELTNIMWVQSKVAETERTDLQRRLEVLEGILKKALDRSIK